MSRYTDLDASHLKVIGNEVKSAINAAKYGIGPSRRFLSYSRSEILEFCRGVSNTASLKNLHLGRRISPAYWVVERAAIIFLNNVLKATRAKEKAMKTAELEPESLQRGAKNGVEPEETPANHRKRKERIAVPTENDESNDGITTDMLPLDSVTSFNYDEYNPGTTFGFLSPEEGRVCGALAKDVDCTSSLATDALCLLQTKLDMTEIMGVKKPSEDFIAVSVVKMNDSFGREITIPWQSLYSNASKTKVSHLQGSGWLLKPGQILWWKLEHVWALDKDRYLERYKKPSAAVKRCRL